MGSLLGCSQAEGLTLSSRGAQEGQPAQAMGQK